MIQALPIPTSFQGTDRRPLEAAIATALLDGELQAGDPLASPGELSTRLQLPLMEVIESIARMLSQHILRQDSRGRLFIHSAALPRREVSRQAFLLRIRQLMDVARPWGPTNWNIEPLLAPDNRQVA